MQQQERRIRTRRTYLMRKQMNHSPLPDGKQSQSQFNEV